MRHRMQREKRNELIQKLSQESSKPKQDTAFKSVILEAVQTITNDLTEFVSPVDEILLPFYIMPMEQIAAAMRCSCPDAGDIADQMKQLFVVASTLLPRD